MSPSRRPEPAFEDTAEPHVLPLTRAGAAADVRLATLVADVIRAVTADADTAPRVRFECDVDASMIVAGHPTGIRRLLESLVRAAATSAARPLPDSDGPPLREVVLTAVDTGRAIEIEVADSGPPHRVTDDDTAAAARAGATLDVQPCPEGGSAVTLRLPHSRAHVKAA